MGLRSSPLAYTILPSSAGGLGLFQSKSSGLNCVYNKAADSIWGQISGTSGRQGLKLTEKYSR